MPRIFDNIQQKLLETLRPTLVQSTRADFGVGYFNLRGWRAVDDIVGDWAPSNGQVCRVLVGMQRPPFDDIKALYQAEALGADRPLDNANAARLGSDLKFRVSESSATDD